MVRILALAATMAAAIGVANAQTAPGSSDPNAPALDSQGGRFRFNKITEGFLRLDSQTGQVSLCSARAVGWACQAVPDDRAALDTEIARLQTQVDGLTKEVEGLRAAPAPQPPVAQLPPRPPEPVPPTKQGELKMPSRADLDRAKAFIDDAWRRLVDMLEQWRKDLQRT